MMLSSFRKWLALGTVVIAVSAIGCSGPNPPKPSGAASNTAMTPPTAHGDGDHGHKPSAHGGIIVPVGRDNYHAEAVFETGGTLRLYTLGQDESKVLEVEAQPLTGYVK